MRLPKTRPRLPDDEDVRRLLTACPNTSEGRRNRALIALAADAGLRKEELRRLRISDLDFTTLLIRVHAGKGQKDGVTFFGETTASLLRAWLAVHPDPRPVSFTFCTREGIQLGPYALLRILHRLSVRAGLPRLMGWFAPARDVTERLPPQEGPLSYAALAQTLRSSIGRLCFT